MKKRHVFAAQSVPDAERIVRAARQSGIPGKCICLEARSDLEIRRISDELKNVSMDFVPAAWRGTAIGALAGLLAGLLAMFIPFFGVSMRGAFALAIVGGLVGTWASVLMGAALPDEVRRTFESEIEAGKILVVIDAEPEEFDAAERAIADAGGVRLPFDTISALT